MHAPAMLVPMTPELAAYIDDAPEEQRDILRGLCKKIVSVLPGVEPVMPNGFPVWTIGGQWCCGFATRKKGAMIYVMAPGVLDRHAKTLGKLRSGKSCVEYKASKTLSIEELDALADVLYREAADALS